MPQTQNNRKAHIQQWRRGSAEEHRSFVGAEGEITIDTSNNVAVIHDGKTRGGFPTLSVVQARRMFLSAEHKDTIDDLREGQRVNSSNIDGLRDILTGVESALLNKVDNTTLVREYLDLNTYSTFRTLMDTRINTLDDDIDKLRDEVRLKNRDVDRLTNIVETVRDGLNETSSDVEKHETRIAEINHTLGRVQNELVASTSSFASKAELERSYPTINDMDKKVRDEVGLVGARVDAISDKQHQIINEMANYTSDISTAVANYDSLRDQVNENTEKFTYVNNDIDSIEDSLTRAINRLDASYNADQIDNMLSGYIKDETGIIEDRHISVQLEQDLNAKYRQTVDKIGNDDLSSELQERIKKAVEVDPSKISGVDMTGVATETQLEKQKKEFDDKIADARRTSDGKYALKEHSHDEYALKSDIPSGVQLPDDLVRSNELVELEKRVDDKLTGKVNTIILEDKFREYFHKTTDHITRDNIHPNLLRSLDDKITEEKADNKYAAKGSIVITDLSEELKASVEQAKMGEAVYRGQMSISFNLGRYTLGDRVITGFRVYGLRDVNMFDTHNESTLIADYNMSIDKMTYDNIFKDVAIPEVILMGKHLRYYGYMLRKDCFSDSLLSRTMQDRTNAPAIYTTPEEFKTNHKINATGSLNGFRWAFITTKQVTNEPYEIFYENSKLLEMLLTDSDLANNFTQSLDGGNFSNLFPPIV